LTLERLRRHALAASLFPPTTLRRAVNKLGFVQADPIRSPARAQDLILRHRVKDYRAGDLEARYASLQLEEDLLYAYGFMPRSTWQLLHPRPHQALTQAEERVLAIVAEHKRIHPRELESYLGREREINAWGGYSKVTTRILEALHYRGLLRIAGRAQGIRLYETTKKIEDELGDASDRATRLHSLVLRIASILAPVSESSLRASLRHLAYSAPGLEGRHTAVAALLKSGQLTAATVDGVRYLWPEERMVRKQAPDTVRFLAPFDPLVWDRRRFEHFWGWPYRFEAYTPVAKRKFGYYAMPLLWRDMVVGWVNISAMKGQFSVKPGFIEGKPANPVFRQAFAQEVERFRRFLAV
jgi:uncharacterized protein YcaQ